MCNLACVLAFVIETCGGGLLPLTGLNIKILSVYVGGTETSCTRKLLRKSVRVCFRVLIVVSPILIIQNVKSVQGPQMGGVGLAPFPCCLVVRKTRRSRMGAPPLECLLSLSFCWYRVCHVVLAEFDFEHVVSKLQLADQAWDAPAIWGSRWPTTQQVATQRNGMRSDCREHGCAPEEGSEARRRAHVYKY